MKFITFPDRVREGLTELMAAYYSCLHPFTPLDMQGPQQDRNLPPSLPRGGAEEAIYYMMLCNYMSGAADSMTMTRRFVSLYEAHRTTLFDPSIVAEMSTAEIGRLLMEAGLNYRAAEDEIPKAWSENSRRIINHYNGDIRPVFSAAHGDWQNLYRLLVNKNGHGLVGFQEKMASMLAFFLMRKEIVDYFMVPPQVDFHVMRVFWSCNLVVPVNDNGSDVSVLNATQIRWFQNAIRHILVDHELTTGQNWLDLSEALWTQSRELCKLSPSNSMQKDDEGAIWQDPITWTADQRKRYRKGCGVCALQHQCTVAIPSAPYYGIGPTELWRYGPRQVPPPEEGVLFDPD